MEKTYEPLRRSRNKVIGGVCGGIGERLRIDPVIVRLVFLLLFFGAGSGLLVYIILWIVLPEAPYVPPAVYEAYSGESMGETTVETAVPPVEPARNSQTQLWLGVTLIGAGLLFLFAAFLPGVDAHDLWPVILIIIGVLILKPSFKS